MTEFCGECKHLEPTEAEQDAGKSANHYCNKFKKFLFHKEYHPDIVQCMACKKSIMEQKYGALEHTSVFRFCMICGDKIHYTEKPRVHHKHTHREGNSIYKICLEKCRTCADKMAIDNEWIKGFVKHLEGGRDGKDERKRLQDSTEEKRER